MKVKVIPVLEDNYMYLVIEEHTREAVAVDVSVPKRLLEIVGREGVSLTTVLTTHHHWDHARGNAELVRLQPGLVVLGADERICALTRRLVHGEELQKVFCGHEHTLGNLEFAQKVEPCNDHVRAKLSWAKKRDDDDVPTVPSTLGEELLYNPFLRVAEEPVRKFTGKVAPAEVLEVLCRERASFERAAEPLQPQARALLALQWGLLSTPQQK
ncbi:Hydroxyacylglutathione hydrolase-like protein [Camelus dromedarius]|uniref:Hydroxyacylglutathione hydrolase-like protein n=1 Tax=Camelus dromedarius TaxID=9838 RepID=A0A5N4BYT7_CAMDR|nr:Hydroxyacylglutathione hydrolase-like protein [Camelus dromedarius]